MAYLTPLDPARWDESCARHLLNRAGFGAPQSLVYTLAELGPDKAVSHLLDYEQQPARLVEPDFLVTPEELLTLRAGYRGLNEQERRRLRNDIQKRERAALEQLKVWWLARMIESPRPLEEKLALFWHGHFATSAQKVKSSYFTYQLNKTFRGYASGNLKTLTTAVGQSYSMLTYLDNFRSTKNEPNENWARELMELFTLGKGQYTEEDIKASARAFTGWARDPRGFVYRKETHDYAEKTFMGRTGDFSGWDVIDIIFEQPVAATFVPSKLWGYFAYDAPEPELVQALGDLVRASNFELKPVLRAMFLSEAFYSEKAMGGQIKSPAQLMVQLAEDLELEQPPYAAMTKACSALGQDIFFPPNVKGWEGNRAWINANTLLLRYNLAPKLAQASLLETQRDMMADARSSMAAEAGMQETIAQQAPPQEAPKPGDAVRTIARERIRQVEEKLRALPLPERRAMRKAFRKATPEQRAALLEKLGLEPMPWQGGAPDVFADLEFKDGSTCVDALARRFLVAPIQPEQRDVLVAALGVKDASAPLKLEEISFENRRAALHLITSMAEYQLC